MSTHENQSRKERHKASVLITSDQEFAIGRWQGCTSSIETVGGYLVEKWGEAQDELKEQSLKEAIEIGAEEYRYPILFDKVVKDRNIGIKGVANIKLSNTDCTLIPSHFSEIKEDDFISKICLINLAIVIISARNQEFSKIRPNLDHYKTIFNYLISFRVPRVIIVIGNINEEDLDSEKTTCASNEKYQNVKQLIGKLAKERGLLEINTCFIPINSVTGENI